MISMIMKASLAAFMLAGGIIKVFRAALSSKALAALSISVMVSHCYWYS